MNEIEQMKATWLTYEQKLDRKIKLNTELLKTINLDKTKSKLTTLTWYKGASLGFYLLSTLFFIGFACTNLSTWYIAISGFIIALWTLSIVIASIHELELIRQIDYAAPVTELQKKLSQLKFTIIKYLRLAIWIFPLYMVFVVLFFKLIFNLDIIAIADKTWLLSQIPVSILFLIGAIWAHNKLVATNANKSWMNKLLRGNGSQITEALNFLNQIEQFEKDVK